MDAGKIKVAPSILFTDRFLCLKFNGHIAHKEIGLNMPIPDFQSLMLPVLKYATSQTEHSLRDVVAFLAEQFSLTEEERVERLRHARQPRLYNMVGCGSRYRE